MNSIHLMNIEDCARCERMMRPFTIHRLVVSSTAHKRSIKRANGPALIEQYLGNLSRKVSHDNWIWETQMGNVQNHGNARMQYPGCNILKPGNGSKRMLQSSKMTRTDPLKIFLRTEMETDNI
jgi:hypothetical protein